MSGETEFRKWMVKNANSLGWMIQSIETSTGSGVPDIFVCNYGWNAWAELKSTNSNKVFMRISQFRWFIRYVRRGGIGLLIIKRLKERRIDVYKMLDLEIYSDAKHCELKGNDIYFPDFTQPAFSYKLGTGASTFFNRLLRLIQTGK